MTVRARFIEPMLLQQTARLPEGAQWLYELKLDGYRAIAFKADGRVHLRSRNDKDSVTRYLTIASALSGLPDETVIDGEVVALDATGKPSFNLLPNFESSKASLIYYAFDVLILPRPTFQLATSSSKSTTICCLRYSLYHRGDAIRNCQMPAELSKSSEQKRRPTLRSSETTPDDPIPSQLRGFGPLGLIAILAILLTGNVAVGTAGGVPVFLPVGATLVLVWRWISHTTWRELGYVRPKSRSPVSPSEFFLAPPSNS
jgi:hypothetical protein